MAINYSIVRPSLITPSCGNSEKISIMGEIAASSCTDLIKTHGGMGSYNFIRRTTQDFIFDGHQ